MSRSPHSGCLIGGFCLGVLASFALKRYSEVSSPFSGDREQTGATHNVSKWRDWRWKFIVRNGYNKANSGVADDLFSRVKVLCFVIVTADQVPAKRSVFQQTWGKRCDRLLLFSNQTADEETIYLNIPKGSFNIEDDSYGTIGALKYLFTHHLQHAQWLIRLHPMTYVVMENLRYFLNSQDFTRPALFGQILKEKNVLFPLGQAGYVISREALVRFGKLGHREAVCRPSRNSECIVIGRCFQRLGIKPGDSRDVFGRSRFHGISVESIAVNNTPDWFRKLDSNNEMTKQGISSVSDNAITFNPIGDDVILAMEYFIYQSQPHGKQPPSSDVNRNQTNR